MEKHLKWAVGIAAAVVLVYVLSVYVLPSRAHAADLGGNCCSDLEERIAELEATVATKGNRKVSAKISGEVNEAILWHDAEDFGVKSDTKQIANSASENRVAITGAALVRPGVWAGYTLELAQGRSGIELSAAEIGIGTDREIYTRQSFAFVKSQDLGTLSVGLQSMATDDLAQQNVANTGHISKRGTAQPIGGVIISVPLINLNYIEVEPFNGRKANSVRYTSPTWQGFAVSAAWASEDDAWDVALTYGAELSGFKVAAAVGYYDDKTNDIIEQIVGPGPDIETKTLTVNGGVKHIDSGLFVQASWFRLEIDGANADTDAYHVQAGIERKWFSLGATTLFAEYADWDDVDLSFYGLGINQSVVDGAVDVYALARRYEISGSGGGDIDTILGGVRVQF